MTTLRERIARGMLKSLDDNDCVTEPYSADLTNVPVHGDLDLLILADAVLAELRPLLDALVDATWAQATEWGTPPLPQTVDMLITETLAQIDAAGAE
jgi:hypothetical protein